MIHVFSGFFSTKIKTVNICQLYDEVEQLITTAVNRGRYLLKCVEAVYICAAGAICISPAAAILKVSVKNLVFSANILIAGS